MLRKLLTFPIEIELQIRISQHRQMAVYSICQNCCNIRIKKPMKCVVVPVAYTLLVAKSKTSSSNFQKIGSSCMQVYIKKPAKSAKCTPIVLYTLRPPLSSKTVKWISLLTISNSDKIL